MISATYFRKPLGKTFWFGFRMIAFHLPEKFRALMEAAVEGVTGVAGYLVCNSFCAVTLFKAMNWIDEEICRVPLSRVQVVSFRSTKSRSKQCFSDSYSDPRSGPFYLKAQLR